MNPNVSHWFVNKNKLLNQKDSDGNVLRIDEKSVEEMERLILQYTEEGDLVMDCFAGTGTTGAACAKLNRRFIPPESCPGLASALLVSAANSSNSGTRASMALRDMPK